MRVASSLTILALVGCGGTPAPPVVATAAMMEPVAASAPIAEPEPAPESLPKACAASAGDASACPLPPDFAERLCNGSYPEVALHLFAPNTPWKRAYLRRSFKAWHVGGRGELRELRANEEVLVLSTKAGAGASLGMGGQAFEVLRWDGTCVSLMEDEVSFHKPGAAVPANIQWKKLDPAFRTALGEDKQLEQLRAAWTRACDAPDADKEPGKTKCELALRRFSLAVAQSVGKGKPLPPPNSMP